MPEKPPNSEMLRRLLEDYYSGPVNQSIASVTSSHWKHYGDTFKVEVDAQGDIRSLQGSGFGSVKLRTPLHWLLDRLCVASHLTYLEEADRPHRLWADVRRVCKRMGLDATMDSFRYACTAALLRRYAPEVFQTTSLRILMIGDGYGILASLLKNVFVNAKMVMVDLGRTLLFQAFYCQKAHPNLNHAMAGERSADNADFLYCPAERLAELDDLSFDAAVNIASMQEMNPEMVASYFDFMRKRMNKPNLFYCCNREAKTLPGGEVLEFRNYPWRQDDVHRVDGPCPWHQYFFAPRTTARGPRLLGVRLPFVNFYDGLTLHRLSALSTD